MKKWSIMAALLVVSGIWVAVAAGPAQGAKDPGELVEQAMGALEAKDYAKAIEACKQAIRVAPNDPAAHYLMGSANFGLGRYQEALTAYEKAAALNPKAAESPDLQYELGMTYLNLKRYPQAVVAFNKVVRADPNHPRGHYGLVGAYLGQGKQEEATKAYRTLQRLDPEMAKKVGEQLNLKP